VKTTSGILGRPALALLLLPALCLSSAPVWAGESACITEAQWWIQELKSDRSEVLLDHARTRCDFAGRWLAANRHEPQSEEYRQLCTSLVLVWTHKECVYFRDEIDYRAYAPCDTWSRLMFRQCLAGDSAWFQPGPDQ